MSLSCKCTDVNVLTNGQFAWRTKGKNSASPVWNSEIRAGLELELDPSMPVLTFGWPSGNGILSSTQFHVIEFQ